MNRKDAITLGIATILVIGALVAVVIATSKKSANGPKPPQVTKINPDFDSKTIDLVKQNFPVNLDLNGLGRPDPFAGI